MAIGTPLSRLLVMLRAEARLTQSVAAGLNSDLTLRQLLARTQDNLWLEYDWPKLRVYRDITTQAGLRYYTFPSDLDFNRVHQVEQKWNSLWRKVHYGIGEQDYNLFDPDADRRTDPVIKWQLSENNQIELWPLPATNGIPVRIRGVKNLGPLVADSDTATLDDLLIVLVAASEVLVSSKASDAKAKLEAASRRLNNIKGDAIKRTYNMRGNVPQHVEVDGEDPFRIRVTYARAG